ncbi:uncharacterized protein ARMOST_20233 [Armillaria ostoyae]|uniref:Uncharacterized protein n=1 Tax=Armillaria ostoyae TaxID=47428 RepID=A0A284S6T3_ARMOS|nr:uncharacterized protein ARMOST_20233 [Armillaria ostoyae]
MSPTMNMMTCLSTLKTSTLLHTDLSSSDEQDHGSEVQTQNGLARDGLILPLPSNSDLMADDCLSSTDERNHDGMNETQRRWWRERVVPKHSPAEHTGVRLYLDAAISVVPSSFHLMEVQATAGLAGNMLSLSRLRVQSVHLDSSASIHEQPVLDFNFWVLTTSSRSASLEANFSTMRRIQSMSCIPGRSDSSCITSTAPTKPPFLDSGPLPNPFRSVDLCITIRASLCTLSPVHVSLNGRNRVVFVRENM